MFKLKLSPQAITLWVIGIIILPRLLSSYHAPQIGTVCIMLFWVAMLVLFEDFIEGYELKDYSLASYPLFSRLLLLFICLISLFAFIWRNSIFIEDANSTMSSIRRILYCLHPMLCMAWLPKVPTHKIRHYLLIIGTLTVGMALVLIVPMVLNKSTYGQLLNIWTAHISSDIFSVTFGEKSLATSNIIEGKNFSLRVESFCASSPQIMLCLFSLLVCYLTCKLQFFWKLIVISIICIKMAFFANCIRIAFLGYLVSIESDASFDFWHEGFGSLIFSLIVMTFTCGLYYLIWSRENPSENISTSQN